jgi:hypothetical protein
VTEEEWLACTDSHKMLMHLEGKVSGRKLRLFGCACCRRIWHLFTDERSREVIEVAERYADGGASDDELNAASRAAWAVSSHSLGRPAAVAEAAAEATWGHDAFGGAYHASLLTYNVFYAVGEAASESIVQCDLLRDIIGNPFRPVIPDPGWQTTNAVTLARTMYDSRDFTALPLLADLLEEAGCPAEVSAHCRGPGPHVRGCWVIDLLTGRS